MLYKHIPFLNADNHRGSAYGKVYVVIINKLFQPKCAIRYVVSYTFYYFFISSATHSTHSSMLSVSFLAKGKGMRTSGAMPRPSEEKSFS